MINIGHIFHLSTVAIQSILCHKLQIKCVEVNRAEWKNGLNIYICFVYSSLLLSRVRLFFLCVFPRVHQQNSCLWTSSFGDVRSVRLCFHLLFASLCCISVWHLFLCTKIGNHGTLNSSVEAVFDCFCKTKFASLWTLQILLAYY